jgi:branched-chain amino acid transport system permease protein
VQIILNGLIAGIPIAQLAIAFQLVYLPSRVFFVGLAGLYALTPYAYLTLYLWYDSSFAAIAGSLAIVMGLAIFLEWINHAPLTRKGASEGAHLISSLGSYIVLVACVAMIAGNDSKTLPNGIGSTLRLGETALTWPQVLAAAIGGSLLVAFISALHVTGFGLRLRALADNPTQFAIHGYNAGRYRMFGFALAGLFAGTASLLTSYDIGFTPHSGLPAVLLAIVAVITGGRSSFMGPIVGGLLLGELRAQVAWYSSARWQEAATFAVLALFLLFRPRGLFGRKGRLEATAS